MHIPLLGGSSNLFVRYWLGAHLDQMQGAYIDQNKRPLWMPVPDAMCKLYKKYLIVVAI